MELKGATVLILGGSGLVGQAVARRFITEAPGRMVLASLLQEEAESAVATLREEFADRDTELEAAWGDIFVPVEYREKRRHEILADPEARGRMIDDLYGELSEEVFERSSLGSLLVECRPHIIVDCINTAGALAYRNAFASAADLRAAAEGRGADSEAVERHLATLYLPQLIRHVQIFLEGMKRAGTGMYVKVGTSGTGGMGLNIPFTHSEERPSRVLLAKAGLAGAHTLFLYLMARTPGAPAVKEIKPTAAISWKSIGFGAIYRGGKPLTRSDTTGPVPVREAFGCGSEDSYQELDEPLEGVYLDAGENGVFSMSEFETLTSLGLMEYVTPEEIAESVYREVASHPTGLDVIGALDAATMGPTYRAGVLRGQALRRMEEMEEQHGVRAVAFEMLGPPRLSKLLFEAAILGTLYGDLDSAAALDAEDASARSADLVEKDGDLRQRILSIGLPILLPDGESMLRGARVKVPLTEDHSGAVEGRVSDRGWVDLRPSNWEAWKGRIRDFMREMDELPGILEGSRGDHQYGDGHGTIRPGRLGAWIFRHEDRGERIKR